METLSLIVYVCPFRTRSRVSVLVRSRPPPFVNLSLFEAFTIYTSIKTYIYLIKHRNRIQFSIKRPHLRTLFVVYSIRRMPRRSTTLASAPGWKTINLLKYVYIAQFTHPQAFNPPSLSISLLFNPSLPPPRPLP